ncbi:uridine kinase [Rhodococcus sp. 27YEA15]|uniref:hypothetical protein n=1 Tax=Rhodococcus sp. 27YEA15 TaxID=3156259 RepID=UPI003C7ADFBB
MTDDGASKGPGTRQAVVGELAAALCEIECGHPVRVAVDGVTASGKSTVATEIQRAITSLGRPAVHLSMDGFHHRRADRHRRGRLSAEGYYLDAYDFDALIEYVLVPCGPGGDRRIRRSIIDLATDTPASDVREAIPAECVLIVDGTFLHREPVGSNWDATVFVDTDLGIARRRGVERDTDLLGGREQAEEAFDQRYHAASKMYLDVVRPAQQATVVFENNDVEHPVLRRG